MFLFPLDPIRCQDCRKNEKLDTRALFCTDLYCLLLLLQFVKLYKNQVDKTLNCRHLYLMLPLILSRALPL